MWFALCMLLLIIGICAFIEFRSARKRYLKSLIKPIKDIEVSPEPTMTSVPILRSFTLRDERQIEIRKLWDQDKKGSSKLSHYLLWRAIADIYPEVEVGNWYIDGDALQIVIKEGKCSGFLFCLF